MRDINEITSLIRNASHVRQEDPRQFYKHIGKLGQGGFATVFKVVQKGTGKEFALKVTGRNRAERQSVINESALIRALNCPYIVSCIDVFDYDNRISVFLEIMDGGDFTKLIENGHKIYSEDFCKYSLYMVAKGLQCMHS